MSSDTQLAVLPPVALARNIEPALWNALSEIYDNPSPEKLALVVDYCKVRKFDPLKKPVYIVPTWSKKAGKVVETIWPAISELRITAMRTNNYAGMEECKFGPILKHTLGNMELEFPEWAQITINRIVRIGSDAKVLPWPGPRIYFVEAYATKKGDQDLTPNSMWAKRTWGQLEKCAEAAALRRAFPEECGNDHTAEEMHGRIVHDADGLAVVTPTSEQPSAGGESAGTGGGSQPEGGAGGEGAPAKARRAKTPGKGASAAAPVPSAPASNANVPAGGNGVVVEAEVTDVTEKPADSAPPAAGGEPSSEPKAEKKAEPEKPAEPAGRKPKYPQPEGWPLVIEATVSEVAGGKDMMIEDIATGEKEMKKINLVTLVGKDVEKHQLPAKVVFDPSNAKLNGMAKKGEAVIKLTLESWPSQSRAGAQVLVAVDGEDVDVI